VSDHDDREDHTWEGVTFVGTCPCGGSVYVAPVKRGRRQHGCALRDPDEGGELVCRECGKEVDEADVVRGA
jgi:hypothetical protein